MRHVTDLAHTASADAVALLEAAGLLDRVIFDGGPDDCPWRDADDIQRAA